jgi:hypothetical protein
MTQIIEPMPAISDDDLITLLTKARRLARAGADDQKAAAAELLPALEELMQARKSVRLDLDAARQAAARKALH